MRIVSVCGSLGSESANRAALDLATEQLRASSISNTVVDAPIAGIPMLDPELVDSPPPAVVDLRSRIEAADGVLLAAPEYAGGLAGGMKNALDWLVGSSSLYHRRIAVLSAGTSGGEHAIEQLVRTLSWHGALTVACLGISAPRTKMDPDGRFVDEETVRAIEGLTNTIVATAELDTSTLRETVLKTVAPFGIEAARFDGLY